MTLIARFSSRNNFQINYFVKHLFFKVFKITTKLVVLFVGLGHILLNS